MKNLKFLLSVCAVVAGFGLFSFLILSPLGVSAGSAKPNVDEVVTNVSSQKGPTVRQMKNSKPFANPQPVPDTSSVKPDGGPTSETISETTESLGFSSDKAYGEFGVPYTSKRVSHDHDDVEVSDTSLAYLSATYPYRAIGRLNFKEKGDWTHCSASLILKSVIVTAAHCIQDYGTGNKTFSNWTFVPGYFYNKNSGKDPVIPYGSWVYEAYVRPASWANGTDTGKDSARNNDLVVILLAKDDDDNFLGDKIGWLKYGLSINYFISSKRTGDLYTAALTTLGYPGKSDNGSIQQRCDGPSYLTTIDEAAQIYQGSDFTGGSSGGPWIANFGYQEPQFSKGVEPGKSARTNVVIGVTSWGDGKPGPEYDNYSSRFGQNMEYPKKAYGDFGAGNIAALLDTLCSKTPDGNDKTYQELGYCDDK